MTKQFVDEYLKPIHLEHFRNENGPTREIIKEMGNRGLLGLVIPEEYGG